MPRPNEVDLRLLGWPAAVEEGERIVLEVLGPSIFAQGNAGLEEVLVGLLVDQKATVAIAESCTGGLLANRITDVPGASGTFLAGYVTYSDEAKSDVLNVPKDLLSRYGAVSGEVAQAMAEGARNRSGSDYALATTGIAGPAGGSPEKPVGTVFIALSAKSAKPKAQKLFFPTDRATFKQMVAQAAFELLRRTLIGEAAS